MNACGIQYGQVLGCGDQPRGGNGSDIASMSLRNGGTHRPRRDRSSERTAIASSRCARAPRRSNVAGPNCGATRGERWVSARFRGRQPILRVEGFIDRRCRAICDAKPSSIAGRELEAAADCGGGAVVAACSEFHPAVHDPDAAEGNEEKS